MPSPRPLSLAVAAVAAAAAIASLLPMPARGDGSRPSAAAAAITAPSEDRQRVLLTLVRQDCGACHGLRLTGGLGPALTPDALARLPSAAVAATIVHGRPGTPMPPWRRFLTEDEAAWLAERLAEGLPPAPGAASPPVPAPAGATTPRGPAAGDLR